VESPLIANGNEIERIDGGGRKGDFG
jgi:hypothetical protein